MTAFEFLEKDIYTMITESDIENYPGMALRSLGAGKFKVELWDTDKFFIKGGKTPWRIITVCRSLEELVRCRVITHSAAPSSEKIYENAEWIRPGKSAWSYFIDEEHSRRFEKIMEFNALAEQAGYEYNLADSGWRDWARTERGAFKKLRSSLTTPRSAPSGYGSGSPPWTGCGLRRTGAGSSKSVKSSG